MQYDGGRTAEDFIKFLNEKCDLYRVKGGGLNAEVRPMYMYVVNCNSSIYTYMHDYIP